MGSTSGEKTYIPLLLCFLCIFCIVSRDAKQVQWNDESAFKLLPWFKVEFVSHFAFHYHRRQMNHSFHFIKTKGWRRQNEKSGGRVGSKAADRSSSCSRGTVCNCFSSKRRFWTVTIKSFDLENWEGHTLTVRTSETELLFYAFNPGSSRLGSSTSWLRISIDFWSHSVLENRQSMSVVRLSVLINVRSAKP